MIKCIMRAKYPLNLATKKLLKHLTFESTKILSDYTVDAMQKYISASIQRPGSTGNLKNSIFSEEIPGGFGVGNINYLNQNAPYWYWINYGRAMSGRTTPPITRGRFSPGNPQPDQGSFRDGRFSQENDGFLLQPKKPIEAHNFIEKCIADVSVNAKLILGKIKI